MDKTNGLPQARAMTRKELKAFRAAGLDPVFITPREDISILRFSAESNDWILDNLYGGYDLDDAPCDVLAKLCEDTFTRTYGIKGRADAETKNS